MRLERAQLERRRGDLAAAARDLETILAVSPRHAEALLALADVRLGQNDRLSAVKLFQQYNEAVEHPEKRAAAERRLADVMRELGDRAGAISSLDVVLTVYPDDIGAREQLVGLLAEEGRYGRAAEELEKLAPRRADKKAGARDELRAARLFRDKVKEQPKAQKAAERALGLDPLSLDAVKDLAGLTDGNARAAMLRSAAVKVRSFAPAEEVDKLRALHTIAVLAADDGLAFAAVSSLVALDAAHDDERKDHLARRAALAAIPVRPRRPFSTEEWARIAHPNLAPAWTELWAAAVETLTKMSDHEPAQLGFTRSDKIPPRLLAKSYPAVDAAARLFGLGDIEVYVATARAGFARAVPLDTPTLFLGEDVAQAESTQARVALGKALAAARLRTGALDESTLGEAAVQLASALRGSGVEKLAAVDRHVRRDVESASVDERGKLFAKQVSRRDRKGVVAAAAHLDDRADLAAWHTALRATIGRAGLILACDMPAATGTSAKPDDTVAADLIEWAVGDVCQGLRKELGL